MLIYLANQRGAKESQDSKEPMKKLFKSEQCDSFIGSW